MAAEERGACEGIPVSIQGKVVTGVVMPLWLGEPLLDGEDTVEECCFVAYCPKYSPRFQAKVRARRND